MAKLSKSPYAQSCAYSALTTLNVERGRPDRALLYAKHGVRLREVPEGQHAWMQVRNAWALALVRGQQHASRDELERAQAPLAGRGFADLSEFDVADMMGSIGIALNRVGAYREAHSTLDEAVALLGGTRPNLQSEFLAEQVIPALRISRPSIAADRMLALTRVAPLVDSGRVDGHLRDVLAESARWATVPEIRDARAQLETLVTAHR